MSLVEHSLPGDRHDQSRLVERSILCRETDTIGVGWTTSLEEHSLSEDGHGQGGLSCEFSGAFFVRRQIQSR